jgi:hypothetical protein
MSREKIKVPGKVYDELIALQREIHFTQDTGHDKKSPGQGLHERRQLDPAE